MEVVFNYVKSLGIRCRHPYDDFLNEGNKLHQSLKPFGICDFGNEDFYHKPFLPFSCHMPGCINSFETVMQFEAHYNSCHTSTCKECKRNFPNNHLLDIHISEAHDSFFKELAKRKPMFQCFVEECRRLFSTPDERSNHCIDVHKFPRDFRFGVSKKQKSTKKKLGGNKMQIGESSNNETYTNPNEKAVDSRKNKHTAGDFKQFTFGQSQSRKKNIYHHFTKDLANSLPKT